MKRVKIELEFIFRASPAIVYSFITAPACLVRWYCDEVDINNDVYSFYWSGSIEHATMVDDIEEERVRFKWKHALDPNEYLEFRTYRSDITNETILEITDFCDQGEEDETRDVWDNLIFDFKKECGG
jgi:uncharacterized protein YndB with AHSA1/START domain